MHYDVFNGDDILCYMFDGGGRRGATGVNNLSKKGYIRDDLNHIKPNL